MLKKHIVETKKLKFTANEKKFLELLLENTFFKESIEEIRGVFGIKSVPVKAAEIFAGLEKSVSRGYKYLDVLLVEFNLPKYWIFTFTHYLFYGKFCASPLKDSSRLSAVYVDFSETLYDTIKKAEKTPSVLIEEVPYIKIYVREALSVSKISKLLYQHKSLIDKVGEKYLPLSPDNNPNLSKRKTIEVANKHTKKRIQGMTISEILDEVIDDNPDKIISESALSRRVTRFKKYVETL
jgi:hypothetical protein